MPEVLHQLIQGTVKGDRSSQNRLYTTLAPKMFVVCLRYAKNREEAEDILQEGFIKVFENIASFKFSGPFEGWVRRIMVNCALERFRRKTPLHAVVNIEDEKHQGFEEENISAQLSEKELLHLVQQLPPAYKMVFNLYVFEGMKHREIADILNISEGTSKSNLSDARIILKKAIAGNERIAKQQTI